MLEYEKGPKCLSAFAEPQAAIKAWVCLGIPNVPHRVVPRKGRPGGHQIPAFVASRWRL